MCVIKEKWVKNVTLYLSNSEQETDIALEGTIPVLEELFYLGVQK